MGKFFGTDGVRDVAGSGLLTPSNVLKLGQALGQVIAEARAASPGSTDRPSAFLGRDSRVSGPALEACLSAGLLSRGIDVTSGGLLPTPAVQMLTRNSDHDLGIIVSASHNPYHDNGIKVVGADGEKLSNALEAKIEKLLKKDHLPSTRFGTLFTDSQAADRYVDVLSNERFSHLDLSGKKIVLDCANGAASEVAPKILKALGADLITVHNTPDGMNINKGCGALHPEALRAACKDAGAQIGITLDGDGDRSMLVDEQGEVRDGDHILGILGVFHQEKGTLHNNTVVATIMSNVGLERLLKDHGVSLIRTPVGDRNVIQKMRECGYLIGGEQSGHIVFDDGTGLFGDGLGTALRVLEVLQESGCGLSDVARSVRKYPQVLINVAVREKPPLNSIPNVQKAIEEVEQELADSGRVVLRYSGTEPLARVMIEGPDQTSIQTQATRIADAIQTALGR